MLCRRRLLLRPRHRGVARARRRTSQDRSRALRPVACGHDARQLGLLRRRREPAERRFRRPASRPPGGRGTSHLGWSEPLQARRPAGQWTLDPRRRRSRRLDDHVQSRPRNRARPPGRCHCFAFEPCLRPGSSGIYRGRANREDPRAETPGSRWSMSCQACRATGAASG